MIYGADQYGSFVITEDQANGLYGDDYFIAVDHAMAIDDSIGDSKTYGGNGGLKEDVTTTDLTDTTYLTLNAGQIDGEGYYDGIDAPNFDITRPNGHTTYTYTGEHGTTIGHHDGTSGSYWYKYKVDTYTTTTTSRTRTRTITKTKRKRKKKHLAWRPISKYVPYGLYPC